jgi:DNA-binding XRE family transcriptional regulator
MPGRKRPGRFRGTRQRTPSLTDDERRLLRAALKGLRLRFGSWANLSTATGIPRHTLYAIARGTDYGSMCIAQRVAKLVGVPVTVLLGGGVYDADVCPTCGQPWPTR